MTRVPTLLATTLLLGLALLPGCANDPAPAPRAEAQPPSPASAPGGVVVHMGGSVFAGAAVSR